MNGQDTVQTLWTVYIATFQRSAGEGKHAPIVDIAI